MIANTTTFRTLICSRKLSTKFDRKVLAFPVRSDVTLLRYPPTQTEIFVIGTNHHNSSGSIEQVKNLVSLVEPTAVGVELCLERLYFAEVNNLHVNPLSPTVRNSFIFNHDNDTKLYFWLVRNFVNSLAKRKFYYLQNNEKDNISSSTVEEIESSNDYYFGQELMEIFFQSQKRHIPVLLLDRPVSLTASIMIKEIFPIRKMLKTMLLMRTSCMDDVQEYNPPFWDKFIETRDKYMVENLLNYCTGQPNPQRIVVVVGAAHVKGIKEYWKYRLLEKN